MAKKGFEVVGIDFAPGMLKKAQEKIKDSHISNSISFECLDLNQALPYPDNYFDHIIIMQVLSYVHNPDTTIRELFRVLRSGGSFLAMIMIKQKDKSLLGMVKRRICRTPKENISRIRYFLKTFFRVIGLVGFELQGQHRWNPEDFSKYLTGFGSRVELVLGETLFLTIKQ